jgi:hypothetical protein
MSTIKQQFTRKLADAIHSIWILIKNLQSPQLLPVFPNIKKAPNTLANWSSPTYRLQQNILIAHVFHYSTIAMHYQAFMAQTIGIQKKNLYFHQHKF